MKSYSALANSYDVLSQKDCDYNVWSQYLFNVLGSVKTGVDLACGTGKMTELLVAHGYDVIGVDSSSEMLDVASKKVRTRFVLQDMTRFALTRPVDFAVCVNDGVNYLKPSSLQAFFTVVASNLKAGGKFVFDVSSEYKLCSVIADNVFYDDGDDKTLLWTNKQGSGKVTMNVTLFEKRGETYVRSDETHVQYVHTQSAVTSALKSAGFTVLSVTDCYSDKKPTSKTMRLTFSAVKNEA